MRSPVEHVGDRHGVVGGTGRVTLALCGLVVVAVCVAGPAWLAHLDRWADLGAAVQEAVRPRPGVWRLLRGTWHYLVIPALLAATAATALFSWRRDRRLGIVFCVVALATNVVVQGVKHDFLPGSIGGPQLSGHAGVASGLGFAWMAVRTCRPATWRDRDLWVAILVVGGTACGVLLTGWHTAAEVLAPIGIGAGWAIVGSVFVPSGSDLVASVVTRTSIVVTALGVGALATWGAGVGSRLGAVDVRIGAMALVGIVLASTLLAMAAVACATAWVVGGTRPTVA